jgi:hypothetical protein
MTIAYFHGEENLIWIVPLLVATCFGIPIAVGVAFYWWRNRNNDEE